jgi:hypothetical protein
MPQATTNVTAIPARPRESSPARRERHHNRRTAWPAILRCHAPPAGLGLVILVLLYLSLNHLARGIAVVTLCQDWEGLAMAVGLDLLIVAGLNGFAFSANQDAMMWKAVAAALGLSIPVLIYLATRSWAALTIESRRTA